mgnify:CR=1 FL=1
MKILFTGGSSFTGMWFVEALIDAGHTVVAPLLHPQSHYEGTRHERIARIAPKCQLIYDCPFGSEKFLSVIGQEVHWDLFCHHAADVTNYKSPQFDYAKALTSNTYNLDAVLEEFLDRGCHRMVLTGSVFEPGEGKGSDHLRAVSPYGLSKGLTSEAFKFVCTLKNLHLGKFVIPNPFGPYEEERFTSFLARTWLEGKCAPVTFPDYLRDNIHVSLLAKAYCLFAETLPPTPGFSKINPSEYVETQGTFTARFAEALRPRLNVPCEYQLHTQTEFTEPRERVNTDPIDPNALNWNESAAWDALATYYKRKYSSCLNPQ